jgi:hypothetical protein
MKNTLVVAALVLSGAVASAQCGARRVSVSEELHSAGETMVGTVEGAQAVPDSSFHMDGVNYLVRVDHVLHGKMVESSRVNVFSENSPDRFPMQVGQQYLLFVHLDYNRYEVDNCGNSGLLTAQNIDSVRQLKEYAKK